MGNPAPASVNASIITRDYIDYIRRSKSDEIPSWAKQILSAGDQSVFGHSNMANSVKQVKMTDITVRKQLLKEAPSIPPKILAVFKGKLKQAEFAAPVMPQTSMKVSKFAKRLGIALRDGIVWLLKRIR